MTQEELTALTDQELTEQWKKAKSSKITAAVLIGMMIGTSVFAAVKSGFSFFTILPLLLAAFFANSYKKNIAIEKEVKSRNLK